MKLIMKSGQCQIILLLWFTMGCTMAQTPEMVLKKEKRSLYLDVLLPDWVKQIEIHIESDRNRPMTRFSTISPYDPDSLRRKERYNRTEDETWFPVVDVRLEQGMDAVCVFKDEPEGNYTFGGPYYSDEFPIGKEIVLPPERLEYWENSLRVDSKTIEIERFYLRRKYPVLLSEFRHQFDLLSNDWTGLVQVWALKGDERILISSGTIDRSGDKIFALDPGAWNGSDISRERLISSLSLLIDDGLRRQNSNPDSPTFGSFFTFYDLEARLHRSAYWLWGGSPIVKMTVDAVEFPEIRSLYDSVSLIEAMDRVGKLYLKYQVREKNHPTEGSFLVIWNRNPAGFLKWVGTSDSGIMFKWAVLPLFGITGDSSYLESAIYWSDTQSRLLEEHEILPHNYLYDQKEFNDNIFDETGWDPEGHSALYAITGEEEHRQVAREYMEKHMKVFQNENGLWNRNYSLSRKTANPPSHMTRGTGWSMEGLLAMNEMYPDSIYLDYAIKMAQHLVDHQNPDGSWNFVFNAPEGSATAVPSDKATPLWSFLFYRLYKATGDALYLETARKALLWCMENQYTGPDPEAVGGLVGRTNASMVGYRYYYDATCAYATGFFGLAILEELKTQK